MKRFNISVGSWYAYNDCNEKALGSKWIDLEAYATWEEVVEELEKQGFDVTGEDEELFIQDFDFSIGLTFNADCMHPKTLFDLLQEVDFFRTVEDEAEAFIEAHGSTYFMEFLENHGSSWIDNISFWAGMDAGDFGREHAECTGLMEALENMGASDYFDFEKYGESLIDYAGVETTKGIIFVD